MKKHRKLSKQPKIKKVHQIRVQGQLIPVTEEVYLTYYRMKRRELHLQEKDAKHGVFYYSALDTSETNGEDAIPDLISPRVDDMVVDKLMTQRLHECIGKLTEQEQEIIDGLFFQEKSESMMAAEIGISQQLVNYRKQKILIKLKKLLNL
ncbi:MAG: sigma-70 family RNA polymerase sigma factor [Clostridiales bacterium]